jgi:arylsulfatase
VRVRRRADIDIADRYDLNAAPTRGRPPDASHPHVRRVNALRALGTAALCWGLLLCGTATRRADADFKRMEAFRRLWDDLAVGITRYVEAEVPLASVAGDPTITVLAPEDARESYRGLVLSKTRAQDIRPWQFWRTLPNKPFFTGRSPLVVPRVNDPGRALLLGLGFRALGGVAPFLVFWLGALACVPLILWAAWEFADAGAGTAGLVFLALLSSSPYVIDTLSLGRSAVGFYLVGLLLLVPIAVYGCLGRSHSRPFFFVRALAAGGALGVCALCRSGCLFLTAGFVLALALGARRVFGSSAQRAAWLLPWMVALGLLALPYLLLRQPQYHDAWQSIWEGFGDFDRTKGHAWSDAAALEVVRQHGGHELRDEDSEAILRDVVLQHVREDPAWFGGILVRRILATVAQTKLWPWHPLDGASMSAQDSWNEGAMDKYYRYTATVEHLGVGRWSVELPIPLLIAPTAALVALWLARQRARGTLSPLLLVMLCVALATLPVPVLISTAGGQDTEAFAGVYLLGFAFLLQWLRRPTAVWGSTGWVVPFAALLALAGCGRPRPELRAVVLVTVDTLRADHLGVYGCPHGLTPHLDRLAREGVVFERAYTPVPFTLPAVTALMTSRYPEEVHVHRNRGTLSVAPPVLAGWLQTRGWRTGAVVSNPVLQRKSGIDRGFSQFDDEMSERESVRNQQERTAAHTTEAALAQLDRLLASGAGPLFLWVHYQDPHGPYTPPEPHRARWMTIARRAPDAARELRLSNESGQGGLPFYQLVEGHRDVAFYRAGYMGEVAYTDEMIGRLMDGLGQRGLMDQAAVVFAADHGEGMGEDDYWFAHGERLSEALVRVPLLIKRPGLAPERRSDVVSLLDVFPTLAAFTGGVAPGGSRGRDLFDAQRGRRSSALYLTNLAQGDTPRRGLVDRGFKYVRERGEGDLAARERLFALGDDQQDLAADREADLLLLRAGYAAARDAISPAPEQKARRLSPQEEEQLKALGYVRE